MSYLSPVYYLPGVFSFLIFILFAVWYDLCMWITRVCIFKDPFAYGSLFKPFISFNCDTLVRCVIFNLLSVCHVSLHLALLIYGIIAWHQLYASSCTFSHLHMLSRIVSLSVRRNWCVEEPTSWNEREKQCQKSVDEPQGEFHPWNSRSSLLQALLRDINSNLKFNLTWLLNWSHEYEIN